MNKNFLKILYNDGLVSIAEQTFNLFLIWYFGYKLNRQDLVALLSGLQIIDISLGPVTGSFADKNNQIKIIKYTSLFRSILSFFLIFTAFISHVNFQIIFLITLSFLLSLIGDIYNPAVSITAYKLSDSENELVKNNAGFEGVSQLVSVLSAALMALLTNYMSLNISLCLIAFLLLFSNLSVLGSRLPSNLTENNNTTKILFSGIIKETIFGVKSMLNQKVIKTLLPYVLITNFLYWLFWYTQPILLSNIMPHFKSAFSLQEIVIAVSGILTSILIQKTSNFIMKYIEHYRFFLIIQSSSLFVLSIIYYTNNNFFYLLFSLVLFWSLYSIFNTLTGIMMITMIQRQIPESILGTSMGTIFSLIMGITPISGIVSGIITINKFNLIVISGLMVVVLLLSLVDKNFSGVLIDDHS